jgi:hypothetical protein
MLQCNHITVLSCFTLEFVHDTEMVEPLLLMTPFLMSPVTAAVPKARGRQFILLLMTCCAGFCSYQESECTIASDLISKSNLTLPIEKQH